MKKNQGVLSIFLSAVALVLAIAMLCQFKSNTDEKKQNNEEQKIKEENLVDSATREQLIAESKDKAFNEGILQYINNGGFYTVQDEIERNGKVYKLIQINMIEHTHDGKGNGELAAYFRSRPDLNELFISNAIPENVIDDETEKNINKFLDLPLSVFEEKYDIPLLKKHIFTRNEDFEFVEKWIVSALVKYENKDVATNVIAYKGAVGINFLDNPEKLQVEIFIADKMNCLYCAKKKNESKDINNDCGGLIEGNVYIMDIDDEEMISDITYVRRSLDNEYTQMCNMYIHEFPRYIKITAKNYDMSMKYFADNILQCYNGEKNTEYITHVLYGERHSSTPNPGFLYVYFTTDDYVVLINRTGVPAKYIKMTKEEYVEYEYMDRFGILDKSNDVIIDGEINPELLKELEK